MAEQDQYMNPQGDEGRAVVAKMNEHHREIASWMMSRSPHIGGARRVLDIGCGGGSLMRMLMLTYPNAHIDGVDISDVSVEEALKTNEVFVKWGRMRVQKTSVAELPFEKEVFDVVTALETYFFWPDLPQSIAKAASMVKRGGCLVICSEQYPDGRNEEELKKACEEYHMNVVPNDVMEGYMEAAGLSVETFTEPDRNWVAFVGRKRDRFPPLPRPPPGRIGQGSDRPLVITRLGLVNAPSPRTVASCVLMACLKRTVI